MAYLTFDRPDGKRVDVPEESAQEALRAGYKPVSKGQIEAGQHPVQAGLEAGLRGLTFGTSDAALTGGSERAKKEVLLRKQENPIASGVGEVAGALAPALMGDEANLVGAAGGIAERLVGKGAAGAVARGVTEGTLYGLTPVISDSVLENKPLMSEATAATLLTSAMTGGALSGAFYGGAKLVGAVSRKAAEVAASDSLSNAAGKVEKKALEMQLKIDPNDSQWWDDKLFQFGKEEGVFAGNDVGSVAELAGNVKKTKGQRMGAVLDFLEKQVPAKDVSGDILKAWGDKMQGLARNPEKLKAMQPLLDTLESLEKQGSSWQEYADVVSTWGKKSAFGDLPVSAVERDVKNQGRIALRDALASTMEEKGGVRVTPEPKPADPFAPTPAKGTVNMRAPQAPERVLEPVPGIAKKYLEANEEFAKSLALERIALDAMKKPFNWASASKGAAMGFVFSGGNPVMPAAGMAASMGWHHIEDKLGLLVAGAARKVQEGQLLPRIAEAFHESVMQRLAVAPELLGPYRNAIAEAAGQGADHLMSAHVTLANSPQGSDYMSRMGLSHETPQEYANATEKMSTLHALLSLETSVKAVVSKGAGRFLGKVTGAAPTPERSDRTNFEGRIEALKQIVSDPSKLHSALPQGLMAHAPGLTIQAGQAAVQAANYLLAKAPKNPDEWKPKALQTPYKASSAEVSRWYRYVDAVEDPLILLHQLHQGAVTQEAVETTRTLFPNVFAAIQSEVMGKMTALEKPLNYKQKQALADAFGVQMLGMSTLQAKVIQAMHQSSQAPSPGGAGPGGAKPSSNDGRQQVDSAKNMQTQSQRLESRSQR